MKYRLNPLVIFLALVLAECGSAVAHPVSQGAMDIVIFPDHVELKARVSTEEVFVREAYAPPSPQAPATSDLTAVWRDHGQYLGKHVRVFADGHPLAAELAGVVPPASNAQGNSDRLICNLAYRAASGVGTPAEIRVEEDVLNEIEYAPGNRWEASYVVSIGQPGRTASEGRLLTSRDPLAYHCDWTAAAPAADTAEHAGLDRWQLVKEYIHHGVMHILTGYDHLLFISALALATITFWDLVKVISAFTLAHTVTLTLATFNIVRLSSHVVEPMISASIVFVALQNVFFPGRARGGGRLLVAFFFGLFHGLGFAGGLLEAMENLPGVAVILALAAFSFGVEVGHQAVVLPLFFGLKWVRASQADAARRFWVAGATMRYGSALIAVAGSYYLIVALRGGG